MPVGCWAILGPNSYMSPGRWKMNKCSARKIVELASRFGRYGYRRITALLKGHGWDVNHKRVERNMAAGRAEGAGKAAKERISVIQSTPNPQVVVDGGSGT